MKVKKILVDIVSGANVAAVALMALTGFVGFTTFSAEGVGAVLSLTFPIVLAVNVAFLFLWLLIKPRRVVIPVVGLIICYIPVRTYCPLNVPSSPPDDAIKVLSYNVEAFARGNDTTSKTNPVLDYIIRCNADIVCLQEASVGSLTSETTPAGIYEMYPHRDTARVETGESLMLLSKYPILRSEQIKYQSKGNMSMSYLVNIDGDTVVVVNNHLETVGFLPHEKEKFPSIIKGEVKGDSARRESETLVRKIMTAEKIRVEEAQVVRGHLDSLKTFPMIITGDFNSDPLSRTHRIMQKGLKDCYVESGNGFGWSYTKDHMNVRIDNIICSDHFEPYGCKVDKSIATSDHYPIFVWLEKKTEKGER